MSKKAPAGRPAGVPTPYLRTGSKLWQVKVKVPKGAGGPLQIARSLGTSDEAEAKRRAIHVVAEIRAEIEAKRRNADGTRKDRLGEPTDHQRKLEAWWAERRQPHPSKSGRFVIPDELEPQWQADIDEVLGDPLQQASESGDPEYEAERDAAARQLIGLTLGSRLPVGRELDRYISHRHLKPSYEARTRSAVSRLGAWLKSRPGGDNVHAIDGRSADAFVEHLAEGEITRATVNSLVSALSAYWKWMVKRSVAPTNVWRTLQLPPEKDGDRNAEKRPFSDEEIVSLLSGKTSITLHDLMRIAALSGMRLNEITNLRVGDAQGGVFNITAGKTKAARRKVPIHTVLEPLVKRRTAGKGMDDFLIEELTAPPSRPGRRGGKIGERFTQYRRALRIDAKQEGRRQSDADFHSFRRWFITAADQADQPEALIQALVGHKRGSIALDTYSSGPSLRQRTRVVESVQLPKKAPKLTPGT